MKSNGVILIAEERNEQLIKHGFSNDINYTKNELINAAMYCLTENEKFYPTTWDSWFKDKINKKRDNMSKSDFDVEMRKIAGALLAADIDRIELIENIYVG